jgi:ribonucleotide monophosphatase NagD (HAD superfamily)
MAFGPFNYMLEEHCKRHTFDLRTHYFGKPELAAFDFVRQAMVSEFGEGCFFMVGDNPRADIKGANTIGWGSFLTQTGVHVGPCNDADNPATMVVNTFAEAVAVVLKIRNQKLYL